MFTYELIVETGLNMTRVEDTCASFKEEPFKAFLGEGKRTIKVWSQEHQRHVFVMRSSFDLETFKDLFSVKDERPQPKKKLPRVLIVGHGRHGKDTVADLMKEQYGYRVVSSSWWCTEHVVRPYLESFGITYASNEEAYAERGDFRKEWYDAIANYNTPDLTRVARGIFEEHNAYCGMRNKRELWACRYTKVFDCVVWVDASERLPPEPKDSNTIEPWMADYILDNNGTLDELAYHLAIFMRNLGVK